MFKKRTRRIRVISFLIVSMALSSAAFFISLPKAHASEEGKRQAALIEGAKKEGKVVVYGSTNITEALPMVKKFEARYPFIKTEYVRLSGMSILNRILTEAKADKYLADVMVFKLGLLMILKDKQMVAKYDSPERKFFSAEVKDPEGYWTTQYLSVFVVAYNTNLVRPQEAPKNYEDLLNPKWKGNIGIDFEAYDWFTGMLEVMGEEKGIQYMKKLAMQQPVLRKGETLLGQLLSAGEFAFAIQYPNHIESWKRSSAPVDWAKFAFPAPTSLTSAGILAKAPHPHAARLYYDYLLSEETAEYLANPTVNRIPARTGIKPSWIPKDFQFFPLRDVLPFQARYMKQFDKIFKNK